MAVITLGEGDVVEHNLGDAFVTGNPQVPTAPLGEIN